MQQSTLDKAKFILIIVVVVALSMFIFNQYLNFKYKAEFLVKPCTLCTNLNPQFEECFIKKERVGENSSSFFINLTEEDINRIRDNK